MTQFAAACRRPLAHLDSTIERRLGLDARLIYGFSAPVIVMAVLISLMMISRSAWAMAGAVVVEVLVLALVVAGFMNVLDDERDSG